jgi:transposase
MARRKRFSAEFKRQALRRAAEPGMTDALVCEELGVSTRQLTCRLYSDHLLLGNGRRRVLL